MSELVEAAQRTLDQLDRVDELVDGWSLGTCQMRQKSMTLTIRFDKATDVLKASEELPVIFAMAPALLASWLRKVISGELAVTP